jgi:precorrin-6A synthase
MKKILVIGIGAGNPEHITVEAINALNRADVIFVLDKGPQKDDLTRLRKEICARYLKDRTPRIVEAKSPARDASAPYKEGVEAWHAQKAAIFTTLIDEELEDGACGAFLVWGDPSLYDSTLRILDQVMADGRVAFTYDVIPGVSSIQVLAARHRIPLNAIGEPVLITTGRKLAEGNSGAAEDTVVMLDGGAGLEAVAQEDVEIYWGAYLGTEDEVLIAGRLPDVIDDIRRMRREGKARKGWIMDTYLLRRTYRRA